MVPPSSDREDYPSLGGMVADWMEENLVFGPGDLLGEPLVLDTEKRALLWRMYQVYPKGHEFAGRRIFKRCAISMRKGWAKTELAADIAAVELHPAGPVRCDGFDKHGNPLAAPVRDPYIAMVAYDEEQADLLAYGALREILGRSLVADDFDIGLERIVRRRGDGRAESLASSPKARDGARTTWEHFDETHLMVLPKLRRTHSTMIANIAKRRLADGWSLETTTAPEPGGGSVAEDTMEYAKAVAEGKVPARDFFFFHRQASDEHDLATEDGARAALREASGPMAAWSDSEAIMGLYHDPQYPRDDWERFYCNRLVQSSSKAFDAEMWKSLAVKASPVKDGDLITLGFDGAIFRDSTGLVGTHVATGYQWVIGAWERPYGVEEWHVPEDDVDAAVCAAFERWNVWRLYADPPYWQAWLAKWAGQFTSDRVIDWWTNRRSEMTRALEAFDTAIHTRTLSHDGNRTMAQHVGNAHRKELPQRDEDGRPLWLIQKERPDSPNKIDVCMAAVLANKARDDAIRAGMLNEQPSVYESRGLRTL